MTEPLERLENFTDFSWLAGVRQKPAAEERLLINFVEAVIMIWVGDRLDKPAPVSIGYINGHMQIR